LLRPEVHRPVRRAEAPPQRRARRSFLREAAERQGIGYATARGYLKALFRKTDTHRQGQMVARLLADAGQLR